MKTQRGMTLVELMIVVVILAILTGITVPSYRAYVLRSHRADATSALLRVRSAQERFFLQNNRYADAAELTVAPPAGLGFQATSEHGYYQLALGPDPAVGGGVPSFLVSATAIAGQMDDTACRTFTVTDRGVRGATNAGGTSTPTIIDTCWR